MTEPVTRKKAEVPENCPKCNVAPKVQRKGSYWLLACPNYKSVLSACSHEGCTMGTKRDAIEEWNKVVRKVREGIPT
jgi:hypothetical protein